MYTKHKWISDKYFNFGYVKYLPENYDESKKYPLVIFLHGAGERGDDLDKAMTHGYMKYVRENGREYPFIFIAPQCPDNKFWGCYIESLTAFTEDMISSLPVDEDRVYLTGLSMGGNGTWLLAMNCPDRFAAIAPVCGPGMTWNAAAVRDIPVYMYHGDCDTVVPISESVNMLSALNSIGGKAELHICYGVGHNSWDDAYSTDELLGKLMSHKRNKK